MHDAEESLSGALYCLDGLGVVRRVDDGYCITNGPAVSPEGSTFYHVDTLKRVIYAFDLGADGGLRDKRIFATVEPNAGYPDGLSVDAEGGVWVALYGGWGVRRYLPRGELIDVVKLPCANVTKAAFGGPDRRTLYITSARKGLAAAELTAQPLAGGLFALRVDAPGLPQNEVACGAAAIKRG
jgi:sugar lactone lactonase YvrE